MIDDMGYDLKLPAVGELTLPQWQDWLVRYNAVLTERDNRIEKLEARILLLEGWLNGSLNIIEAFVAADTKEARKALEGKDD